MDKLIGALMFPIIGLNWFGGLVAAIWLLVEGQWRIPVAGLIVMIAGHFAIGILMLPSMLISDFGAVMMEHRYFLGLFVALIGTAYVYVVMGAWSLGVFYYVGMHYEGGSPIPYLLAGYALATGVWQDIAAREQGEGSVIATLAQCVSAFAIMLTLYFSGGVTLNTVIAICAAPLAIGWVVQGFAGYSLRPSMR